MSTVLLFAYGYALNDPTACRTALSLRERGFQVVVCQLPPEGAYPSAPPEGITVEQSPTTWLPPRSGPLRRLERWLRYLLFVRRCLNKHRPTHVVTIMLHPLAALPRTLDCTLVACVYDVPSMVDAGKLDRSILRQGWRRLPQADVVWSSDTFKADLVRQYGHLSTLPLVCHNTPSLDDDVGPSPKSRAWLTAELAKQQIAISDDTCIMLRAGAIGPYGGIEETLAALQSLPPHVVFLMMGRPSADYKARILTLIRAHKLERRVALWDRPSDATWRHALSGADIGHLIHIQCRSGVMKRQFDLNSILSTNRLYAYMAAKLPIVVYEDPRIEGFCASVPCSLILREAVFSEDLAQAVLRLASDPPLRQSLGDAGHRAYHQIYNWQAQFAPVLDRIITQRPSQSAQPLTSNPERV